jgi:hypothetical protein
MAKIVARNVKMPAGEYWIGDLCYVMHPEWNELCDDIFTNEILNSSQDFIIELNDGRLICWCSTAYGDGTYYDTHGHEYGVDAGMIGAILVSDISESDKNNIDLGHIHHLGIFEPEYDNGILTFDTITIDTMGFECEDDMDDSGWYQDEHEDEE